MIGTPLVVTIKDFKHDTVNTVLPKIRSTWGMAY